MLTIYLLVIALARPVPCPEQNALQKHPWTYACPSEQPVVGFYFKQKNAVAERDSMMRKGDAPRLFKIEFRLKELYGVMLDQIEAKAPKALSITEITTTETKCYDTTEAPVAITP